MQILEAILAFALAMLVFSTLVSALVEALLNRVFSLRRLTYQRLLERFYDDHIWARFQELTAGGNAVTDMDRVAARRRFVAVVGHDPKLSTEECIERLAGRPVRHTILRVPHLPFTTRPIVEWQTPVEFAERLADTAHARAIETRAAEKLDLVIDDLARKYEQYGANSRARFTNMSRNWSVVIAIAFCFLVNIEAGRLFSGFLHDTDLTQKFLAQSEAYLKAAKETEVSKEALKGEVEAGLERIKEIGSELGDLRGVGLPIGFDYFPGCAFTGYSGESPVPADAVVAHVLFQEGTKPNPKKQLFRWQLVQDDPACYTTLRGLEKRGAVKPGDKLGPLKAVQCNCLTSALMGPTEVFSSGRISGSS